MIKFGTGGWRALVNDSDNGFNKENLIKLSKALAYIKTVEDVDSDTFSNPQEPIVIGYDNRDTSYQSMVLVSDTLNKYGVYTEIYKQSVPTPLVMHKVQSDGLKYGLMITSSHNSYEYNGIKLFTFGGVDASKDFTNHIEEIINNNLYDNMVESEEHATHHIIDTPYLSYLEDVFDFFNIDLIEKWFNKKFLFNPMNGSGEELFTEILNTLNIQFETYSQVKTSTSCPYPSKENLSDFIEIVKKGDFDFGIAFDGDGDRLGVIDELGNYIDMNRLLCMFYWYMKEYRHDSGAVVRNSVTTHSLDIIAKHYGEKCIEVPVGFKWVSSAMKQNDALVGGESSGGMTMRGHINGKDAIFSALMLIEMLTYTNRSIAKLSKFIGDEYCPFQFSETVVNFNANKKPDIMEYLDNLNFGDTNIISHDKFDGWRFNFADKSWLSVRFSGTEPIIRIMSESTVEQDSTIEKYTEKLKDEIERIGC